MKISKQDRLAGIMFGCALGDALGAPVEFLGKDVTKDLRELLMRTGPQGVDRMMYYNCPDVSDHLGIGAVTDDTTMMACSAEAMDMTLNDKFHNFEKQLLQNTHQAFLSWGSAQTGGENCRNFIDPAICWSAELQSMWFRCAAGKGTVSSLSAGHLGSLEKPAYSTHRGSPQPVMGSGGMMRVAVLAALPDNLVRDFFALGKKHALITHSDPVSYQASGVVLNLASLLYRGAGIKEALKLTKQRLLKEPGNELCLSYFERGEAAAALTPASRYRMNWLIEQEKDAFTSGPILAQVIYVLASVESIIKSHSASDPNIMRYILNLSVSHRGDTDSVGAIAGALAGAHLGFAKLPIDWIKQIQKAPEITTITANLCKTLSRYESAAKSAVSVA